MEAPIITNAQILDCPMGDNDAGAKTVRAYFARLAATVWDEGEGFTGKRPFGNSGWEQEVIEALEEHGLTDCEQFIGPAIESMAHNIHTIVTEGEHKSLAQMQAEVYDNNVAHGWFDENRDFGTGIALLHSEVSEAFEEYRDHGMMGYVLDKSVHPDAPDVILIADPEDYGDRKPLGVPSEYADILIRLLDSCQRDGVDLMAEYEAKMKYNRTRPYKHGNKTV